MKRKVDLFRPGRVFPSVSVTGEKCNLNCHHCAGHYLRGMRPVLEPEELLRFARSLDDSGGTGMLLSGGCDASGKVPLARFTGAVRRIKEDTDLVLNAHVGLAPREDLEGLVAAGVDAFSLDLYGTDTAVRETLGLRATAQDFLKVAEDLRDLQAPRVTPHICIGIEGGRVAGELEAISMLKALAPTALVFIVFTPTRGTRYEARQPPSTSDIVRVVRNAREQLPDTRLLLGCMRPRRNRTYEVDVVGAGIDGVVMPARDTVERMREARIEMKEKRTCCSLG